MTASPGNGSDNGLLVIGAGLGRTGTKSLKQALEILYRKPCYHMLEIIFSHRNHIRKWLHIDQLVDRKKSIGDTNGRIDRRLFDELFEGYAGACDLPVCSYYEELMEAYPEAKVRVCMPLRDGCGSI